MERSASAPLIQQLLHDRGYMAKVIDGGIINSAASGLKFQILPHENSIQLRCGMVLDADNYVDLTFINDVNKTYRFLKVYLDDDSDLLMECDWWIDFEKADHAETFGEAIEMWELALSALAQRLRDLRLEALMRLDEKADHA